MFKRQPPPWIWHDFACIVPYAGGCDVTDDNSKQKIATSNNLQQLLTCYLATSITSAQNQTDATQLIGAGSDYGILLYSCCRRMFMCMVVPPIRLKWGMSSPTITPRGGNHCRSWYPRQDAMRCTFLASPKPIIYEVDSSCFSGHAPSSTGAVLRV